MNSRIQGKIAEIKRLSDQNKKTGKITYSYATQSRDGLSIAIRTSKDAETFMAELKAIKKK
ncbi:hypothetical protein [Desertivirga arenae]|uniref:hypothetical protein n=1 Tax=Desertivirga arenae TaxID=2810309 RepID=UPI001A97D2C5|nr:hypothetical protein [Pedobacter sp. SYSU D00823]